MLCKLSERPVRFYDAPVSDLSMCHGRKEHLLSCTSCNLGTQWQEEKAFTRSLRLSCAAGEEPVPNGDAGHDDQPKSKVSRSVKTPLQKEALEAAYSSERRLLPSPTLKAVWCFVPWASHLG